MDYSSKIFKLRGGIRIAYKIYWKNNETGAVEANNSVFTTAILLAALSGFAQHLTGEKRTLVLQIQLENEAVTPDTSRFVARTVEETETLELKVSSKLMEPV